LRIYAGFDWDHDSYLRADRHVRSHQLFYYEKRLTLSGGYAFDRFYFEGGGYSNHNENRIDIHGGPFVVGRIMLRF
jgi:hypothetical protein